MTNKPLELEIYDIWTVYRNDKLILDILSEKIAERPLSVAEQLTLWRFFFLLGKPILFVQFAMELLKKNQPIHWGAWVESLATVGVPINEEIAKECVVWAKMQDQLPTLTETFIIDALVPNLIKIRQKVMIEKQRKFDQSKNELISQIEIDLSQDLLERAWEGLNQLEKIDPNDNYLLKKKKEIVLRKAHQLLEKKRFTLPELTYHPDQRKSENVPEEMRQTLRKMPNKKYDFAILAYESGDLGFARQLLEEKLSEYTIKENELWLLYQCYLETDHILPAAKLLEYFKKHFFKPQRSDHFLIYSYEKARVLWALGDKKKAIRLMDELVQKNPDFRDAEILLQSWLRQQQK